MQDNKHELRVLMLDAATGFYRMQRYRVGDFFGPVDLGIHLAFKHNALTIGAGLLAGSVFPGSNRLIFAGISPCWHGFYVSSMGGAALVFDNLGINMLSLVGKAPHPSLLFLNRNHGEEIEVELIQVIPDQIWESGRQGVYAVMEHAIRMFGPRYEKDPRVLAVGPAARDYGFRRHRVRSGEKGGTDPCGHLGRQGRLRQQVVSGARPFGHHLRRNAYRR
jgi:glyceraldehyde-3-phosphate dehydrogenase (ferredoxin)